MEGTLGVQAGEGAALPLWALGKGRDANSGNLSAEQYRCWGCPAVPGSVGAQVLAGCVTAVALALGHGAVMDPGGFAGPRPG